MTNNQNEDSVKLTVDKFVFTFPQNLHYSETGLWIRQEDGMVRIGLCDFAQQRNGDVAFANLPVAGSVVNAGDEIASIETVKVNLSLPSPLKGRVVEANPVLQEFPEFINQDPYGRGWLVALQVENVEQEMRKLLDAEAYSGIARQQAETELKL